jgi:hypothetical protein
MHRSSIYDNVPMPWSVQVVGDIFMHGFETLPDYPASAGRIRLPLDGGNPAEWLFILDRTHPRRDQLGLHKTDQ